MNWRRLPLRRERIVSPHERSGRYPRHPECRVPPAAPDQHLRQCSRHPGQVRGGFGHAPREGPVPREPDLGHPALADEVENHPFIVEHISGFENIDAAVWHGGAHPKYYYNVIR